MLSSPLNFSRDLIKHILKCFAGIVPKKDATATLPMESAAGKTPRAPHHSLFDKSCFQSTFFKSHLIDALSLEPGRVLAAEVPPGNLVCRAAWGTDFCSSAAHQHVAMKKCTLLMVFKVPGCSVLIKHNDMKFFSTTVHGGISSL